MTDLATTSTTFVKRFRNEVDSIVIWNEPNLSLEWGFRPVDPVIYTKMLRWPISAPRRPIPMSRCWRAPWRLPWRRAGNDWGMDDLVYLQAMYDAGAAPYFDSWPCMPTAGNFPAGRSGRAGRHQLRPHRADA